MTIFNLVLIYIVLVYGLNFPLGFAGQASMGHAALWAIGSYTTALVATRLGWPFYASMLASFAVCLFFGLMIGLPTSRLGGRYLALATIAFGEIVVQVLINWIDVTGGPNGIMGIPAPVVLGYKFDTVYKFYYFSWIFTLLAILVTIGINRSRFGRALKSVRENEMAAEVLGVPTFRIKVLAFLLAAAFASVAGSLYVFMQGYTDPSAFVQFESLRCITMLFIGGAGTVIGPIIGAVLLTLLPEFIRGLKDYYMAVYGIGVVLLMIFMPTGLYGVYQRIQEKYFSKDEAVALGQGVNNK
jgi:branched-chain amino acid transport system permease protein